MGLGNGSGKRSKISYVPCTCPKNKSFPGRFNFLNPFKGGWRIYAKIELLMDMSSLRGCNLTLSENITVLPGAQELLADTALSQPEADVPSDARSHSLYVEMVNYLYGFTVTLG